MNWDSPEERLRLIEAVGEYSRRFTEHARRSVVEVAHGYNVRRVHSPRFGTIYMVDGTNRGSATIEGAREIAREAALELR